MATITADVLARVPLVDVDKVTFFKRDELVTDLIVFEVKGGNIVWTFHEELEGWDLLLAHLDGLPGFRRDWLPAVSQPPFAESITVAFCRES